MIIYFAGSIRGGREEAEGYKHIIRILSEYGTVLTEHVADETLDAGGERHLSESQIYARDRKWLEEAQMVVADVTVPSLGVGYEIALAETLGKPVACLFREGAGRRLSAMIAGNPRLKVYRYERPEDLSILLPAVFKEFLITKQVLAAVGSSVS